MGTYTLTYSCVDTAGNQATPVSRTVIVETSVTPDTTPPVLLLTGSSSVTIEVDDSYSDDGADCNDTVDGNITPTLTGTVNTAQVGTYTLTYSCVDTAGNQATPVSRTVIVETSVTPDTTPPVLLLTGSSSVTIEVDDSYSDDGADCNDTVDGNITPTLTGTVNTAQVGTYTLTYSCVDTAGNQATPVSRTVIVEVTSSNTPPVIPDTNRSSKSSRSNNTPNPLTVDNSIIIGEQNHDLVSGTTTINPHNITTGQSIDLVFTAYSPSDIVRFTVYLNLHGDEIKHSDSDTYIRYDRGAVEIVDPHGFISDASITITEDLEQSRKNIINTLVEFDGDMGLTNMAVYIWNEDRRYTSIRVFDALDITSGMGELPDPEPQNHNGTVGTTSPDIELSGADTLSIIRTWSGFEQGTVTDDELLQVLNLSYQGAHIPNWVMTDLAVLVSKGSVTTDEFVTALTYVLENI